MSQYRNWCFTLHVEEDKDYADLLAVNSKLRCGVWQLERCPSTGRLHLQGYVEFTAPMRMGAVKQLIGASTHLERRQGTRDQAIEYCRKEESRVRGPWTYGDLGSVVPGRRSDLDQVSERILDGASLDEVVEAFPSQYVRYRRGIEALHQRTSLKRIRQWRDVGVHVYFGDSGAGKTRRAVEENPNYFILDQGERVWFDGYEGQECLIIDDFYGWIKYGQLLRILDGHRYRAEVKGGFTWAAWLKIVITSNKHPSEWYSSGLTEALRRRISLVLHFSGQEVNEISL